VRLSVFEDGKVFCKIDNIPTKIHTPEKYTSPLILMVNMDNKMKKETKIYGPIKINTDMKFVRLYCIPGCIDEPPLEFFFTIYFILLKYKLKTITHIYARQDKTSLTWESQVILILYYKIMLVSSIILNM
jgi:hypothetical protein